jgi:Family of unknown function (DUF6328)
VTALEDKVENALNETRMLILGAQVLLGFDFQSTFQPVFERLPTPVQELKVVSLLLMLLAVGLLVAPGAFHQIVERGNDSVRVTEFTGQIAFLALFPFAVSIGIDVYVAAQIVVGPAAALSAGFGATGFALIFWYGLEWVWVWRIKSPLGEEPSMVDQHSTALETRIKQVLTEARVVLPGAQALLGFQFAAILMDAFENLPKTSQYVHLVSLGLMSACIVLLMAPAAFHRIVERGEDTERLQRFSSAMVLSAMVPLALGIAGDFYVVLAKVLDSTSVAVALATASLIFFFGLWFGVTFVVRRRLSSRAVR